MILTIKTKMLKKQLDIETVKVAIETYLKQQRQPVKSKNIARNVDITQKQCRFMMNVYFADKKIEKKHPRYVSNKSFYVM